MTKNKKRGLFAAFVLFCTLFVLLSSYINSVSAANAACCIEATPSVTQWAYDYLDEIYIGKYPDFALEFPFGSEGDRKVLKAAADKITNGAVTDKEKVDKIIKWVNKNIDYRSSDSGSGYIYAIDTYYNKKGNCVGYSQLILNFCRLSGIKAVMCCGARGDMKSLKLDGKVPDHAWTMIYIDGKWCLYDLLFDVYAETDRNFINRWYFFDFIEGVSPYVEKYAEYIWTGDCIFYIDGRFMHYINGVPAVQFRDSSGDGGVSVNNCMPFFTANRYYTQSGGSDGYEYAERPERKDSMLCDECYTDGWFTYGDGIYYAKPNGIKTGARIIDHNGRCLYFSYMSDAVILPGRSEDYTLTDGYLTLCKGEKVSVSYTWLENELSQGKKLKWESVDPEIATIDENNVITAHSEGLATFWVCAVDETGTHNQGALFQVGVLNEKRTVSYSFSEDVCDEKGHTYKSVTTKATLSENGKIEKKCTVCGYVHSETAVYYPKTVKLSSTKYTYDGKSHKPSVTVKDSSGKKLKKDTDYTVKYSKGRKTIGKYTVTVTFKGKYKGTKKLTFKIVPEKTSLSKLTAGKKQLTASWKTLSGVTGYEVQYSTSKSFKKNQKTVTVKKAKSKKKTIKKLKKGKKYYVRVRTYKTVDGSRIYSSWSSAKSIKVK